MRPHWATFILVQAPGLERRRRYTRAAKLLLVAESGSNALSILRVFEAKCLVTGDQVPRIDDSVVRA